jgi:hypothetical protein
MLQPVADEIWAIEDRLARVKVMHEQLSTITERLRRDVLVIDQIQRLSAGERCGFLTGAER